MRVLTGRVFKDFILNEIEDNKLYYFDEVKADGAEGITLTDPIDYSKYTFRPCGGSWSYCTGECGTCPNNNTTVSDRTAPDSDIPTIYHNSSDMSN